MSPKADNVLADFVDAMAQTDDLDSQIKQVSEIDLKGTISQAMEGEECVVDAIYQGKFLALITRFRSLDTLTEQGREIVQKNADQPYYMVSCHTHSNQQINLLVRVTVNEKSTFYQLSRKYPKLSVGMTIMVHYDPKKSRYDFLL